MSEEIKGMKSLLAKLKKLENIDIEPIMANVGAKIKDEAKSRVPVDTSELQTSIDYRVEVNSKGVEAIVFTPKEYAAYVEFGTGPTGAANHGGISPKINPRYSPTGWSYYDDEKKEWIHTNGQKAQPYMYPALKDNEKQIKTYIQTQIRKKIKEIT